MCSNGHVYDCITLQFLLKRHVQPVIFIFVSPGLATAQAVEPSRGLEMRSKKHVVAACYTLYFEGTVFCSAGYVL